MPTPIDAIMQTASKALTDRDYPRCEALCREALALARASEDWPAYSRIVLPLQESRRLMRQAALEGQVRLGTGDVAPGVALALLDGLDAGCLVVTAPLTAEDAQQLARAAEASTRPIEILYAQPDDDASRWTVCNLHGVAGHASRPAPPTDWQNQWVPGGAGKPLTPAHWWMQASESLGNAALDSIDTETGTVERLDAVESALAAVGDHELLHQALADAASAIQTGAVR